MVIITDKNLIWTPNIEQKENTKKVVSYDVEGGESWKINNLFNDDPKRLGEKISSKDSFIQNVTITMMTKLNETKLATRGCADLVFKVLNSSNQNSTDEIFSDIALRLYEYFDCVKQINSIILTEQDLVLNLTCLNNNYELEEISINIPLSVYNR